MCIRTQSSPKNHGSKAFGNLFQRGCLSQLRKSASNDSMRLDCTGGIYQSVTRTTGLPSIPVYSGPAVAPYLDSGHTTKSTGPPAYPTLTFLPNSRSLYQLSPNPQGARVGKTPFPNSRTEMRLCDAAKGSINDQPRLLTPQVSSIPSNIPIAKPLMVYQSPVDNVSILWSNLYGHKCTSTFSYWKVWQ